MKDFPIYVAIAAIAIAVTATFFPLNYWSYWEFAKPYDLVKLATASGHLLSSPIPAPTNWIQNAIDSEAQRPFDPAFFLVLQIVTKVPLYDLCVSPMPISLVLLSIFYVFKKSTDGYREAFVLGAVLFIFDYSLLPSYYFSQGWYAATVFLLIIGTTVGIVREPQIGSGMRKDLIALTVLLLTVGQIYSALAWLMYLVFFGLLISYFLARFLMRVFPLTITITKSAGAVWHLSLIVFILTVFDPLFPYFTPLVANSPFIFSSFLSSLTTSSGYTNPLTEGYSLTSRLALLVQVTLMLGFCLYLMVKELCAGRKLRKGISNIQWFYFTLTFIALMAFGFDIVINGVPRPSEGSLLLVLCLPMLWAESSRDKVQTARRSWVSYIVPALLVISFVSAFSVVSADPVVDTHFASPSDSQAIEYLSNTIYTRYFADAWVTSQLALYSPYTPIISPNIYVVNSSIANASFLYASSSIMIRGLRQLGAQVIIVRASDVSTQFVTPNIGLKPIPATDFNHPTFDLVYDNPSMAVFYF